MTTRNDLVTRMHEEVRDALEKLREHAMAFEEKLQEGGEAEEWQPYVEDARAGVAALEPVLADFDNAGVDPEELVQYASTIEHWQEREAEFSKKLA